MRAFSSPFFSSSDSTHSDQITTESAQQDCGSIDSGLHDHSAEVCHIVTVCVSCA